MSLPCQYLLKVTATVAISLILSLTTSKPAKAIELAPSSTTTDSGSSTGSSSLESSLYSSDNSLNLLSAALFPGSTATTSLDQALLGDSSSSTGSSTQGGQPSDMLLADATNPTSTQSGEAVPEPLTVAGTLLGGAVIWRMRKKLVRNLNS